MPTISVIVPVYKVEKYIHRCVDSILNQTFRDFELILVDDGSPDNCGAICDEYAAKDSRVVVIHQENGGLSAARNAGIDWVFANSDSQWVAFIDSDDWVDQRMLEVLFLGVTEHGTKLGICDYCRATLETLVNDNNHIGIRKMNVQDAYNERGGLFDLAVGKLIHKDLLRGVQFPLGLLFEDAWTMYKVVFATENLVMISNQLYFYFVNEGGITCSPWTPAWLSEIDAHEEQIEYMQTNDYRDTLQVCVELYFSVINKQFVLMRAGGSQNKGYIKKLRRRVTCSLKKYGHYLSPARTIAIWETYHPVASLWLGAWRSLKRRVNCCDTTN